MQHRTVQNAIVRLLKAKPFYGQFILTLHKAQSTSSHPLGVTIREGAPILCVNEERLASFPGSEQEALLEHCVKHLLHLHMSRRKERHIHCWDICCDIAINPSIEGMPAGSPLPVDYKVEEGLAAEEYYSRLVPMFDVGNLSGQGIGRTDRQRGGDTGEGEESELQQRSDTIDDHSCWEECDSTPLRLAEEMVRNITREARLKSDLEVPADIRPIVERLLRPGPIPWQEVLRQFIATAGRVGRRSTWQREHRRFQHDTPGTRKRHRLNLLVGVDVSESTDIREMREGFARELLEISRGRDLSMTVLYANSRIQRIDTFRGKGIRSESYHGGGFTDLRPVFEYAKGMTHPPAAVIYLTDGYGEAPDHMEFPTLWVLTTGGEKPVPWGVELRLEV